MSGSRKNRAPDPPKSQTEYAAREKRIQDAMNLRVPDRVPVIPLSICLYPRIGSDFFPEEVIARRGKDINTMRQIVRRHDWDAAPAYVPANYPALHQELLGLKQIKWPKDGFPDSKMYKWVDNEYMSQDEYDMLLADPNGFALKKLLPRVSSTLAPLSEILEKDQFPLLLAMNALMLPRYICEMFYSEDVIEMLRHLLALLETFRNEKEKIDQIEPELMQTGVPFIGPVLAYPAFDWISDKLRGLRGCLIDMINAPEKLHSAFKMYTPMAIKGAVADAELRKTKTVLIPMRRGAAEFMSNEQYEEFYWPYLKQLLIGLVEADLRPVAIFEGECDGVLEFLPELPPGKIIGHFDKIDRRKAKRLIGNVMCFWGNVSSSLLCHGTPREVRDDVKELIDIFGDNGGLIVDGAMGIPDDAKPENVQAMTEAAHEFGVF
jgi:hypothetical protein